MANPKLFEIRLNDDQMTAHSEITLRDFFAGLAMNALISRGIVTSESVGRDAYEFANSMLEAREAE